MPDFVKVIIFSVSSFLAMFIVAKILGKKQIAELDFADYIVGITIGSIAAEWATELEKDWYHYLIAISIFLVFSLIISFLEQRARKLKVLLRGKPIIIISDGKIQYKNLKKSKLDMHDVLGLLRVQGYFNIDEIAYAIFETNGEMSVLAKNQNKPATIQDLTNPSNTPSSLENDVVIDGVINYDILKTLEKDKNWLFNKLNISKKKQLKNIILATYDEEKDAITTYYKYL